MSNASKLNNMNPTNFILELQSCAFIADKALTETKSTISPNKYETLNPQNQVLANGIFFKNMFDKYLEFLDRKLNDKQLQTLSNQTNDFPKISTEEYKKMPKRYRGVFTQFDNEHYVLHIQDEARPVVSTRKSDKQILEELLDYARILIPRIYRTKWQLNTNASEKRIAKKVTAPDFVQKYSLSSRLVSDNQINTINKLRDIFLHIDRITNIYVKEILVNRYDGMTRHGAFDIYNEYQNELTQKNRYANAQNAINNTIAEYTGLQYLAEQADEKNRSGILVLIDHAKQNSVNIRKQIIANLKKRTK